jgi:hypothetical protein
MQASKLVGLAQRVNLTRLGGFLLGRLKARGP